MLAALAIVIALMIVAMVVIKKTFFNSLSGTAGNALIHVLSTRHLGPKNSLLLIEVAGQVLLVGVSGQQIALMSRIDNPAALEKIKNAAAPEGRLTDMDALARCRTLLMNLSLQQKDRQP